jgi:hypothetical protein
MPTVTVRIEPDVLVAVFGSTAEVVELTVTVDRPASTPKADGLRPRGPLAPLMREGLLRPGQKLYFEQRRAGRKAVAEVGADGLLRVEGKARPFRSPSEAAAAVAGSQMNGWIYWRTEEGRRLSSLRRQLEAGDQED